MLDFGYYNMDCMDGMKEFPDKYFDLAVVDPPYFSGPEKRGFYGRKVSPIGVQRSYRISEQWEVPGQFCVVYECEDGAIWNRPYGMFVSEVDHVKHPNVQQKYRFE